MAQSKLLIFAISLVLTVPVGAATWFSGKGSYEPDTIYDQQDGTMFATADTSADALQVYFNVYLEQWITTLNPNNEILGSRILSTGDSTHHAYLGVWKDCNDDGYIGAANGALHVYPSALNVVCPDGSVFNKGGWVYEFQWIGPGDQLTPGFNEYPAGDDQRWINDTETLVWGDLGLPGAPGGGGGTCTVSPPPAGTTSGTGNFLNYVDCWVTNREIAANVNAIDAAAGGNTGLGFSDPSNPHKSSSLLNQDLPVNLFGNPYAGENNDEWQTGLVEKDSQKGRTADYNAAEDYDPDNTDKAFHVWDCSDPNANSVPNPTGSDDVSVEDPTGGLVEEDGTIEFRLSRDGAIVSAPNPSPGVDNPTGSYYDAVNETERGGANIWFGGNVGGNGAENCNPNNSTNAQNYPTVEGTGDVGTDNEQGRNEHPLTFSFSLNYAGVLNQAALRGDIIFSDEGHDTIRETAGVEVDEGATLNETLGQGYHVSPDIGGFFPTRPDWIGLPNMLNFGVTVRDPVTDPTTPANAFYETFYARIGAATFGLGATTANGNAAKIYGFEWCEGSTSGVIDGFDCDPDSWWTSGSGDTMPRSANGLPQGARAGYSFHLRDFDCYDNTLLRGSGVEASLVDLTEGGPCKDAIG